ncbi:hypothetical protein QL285_024984 [Trifolium repens]|nr:hypothetical protein QL285_024984 [Trifolium repens]
MHRLISRATAPPPPPHPRTHQKSFERSTTTTTTRLSPPAATFSLSLLDRTTFLSLSARPIFKAISPDLKNAATDHQDKSFVYLLLPFVSQSLFSRQRRGRRRALPHRVVWNRFLAGMPKSQTINGVEVNYDSYDDDDEDEENHESDG